MSEPSEIIGLPEPHVATHAGGNAGDAARDLEAVLLEHAGEVLRRLLFLHPKLAEAEDLIDHLLGERRHAVDETDRLLLQARELGVVRRQSRRGR